MTGDSINELWKLIPLAYDWSRWGRVRGLERWEIWDPVLVHEMQVCWGRLFFPKRRTKPWLENAFSLLFHPWTET